MPGVTPLVAQALKKVGLLKSPGEMGMLWGKINFVSDPFVTICECGGCSPVGGVALPLLIESL